MYYVSEVACTLHILFANTNGLAWIKTEFLIWLYINYQLDALIIIYS